MAQSSAPNAPQDRYCFTFTGFAVEHKIEKRAKYQQVTTQFVSSICYTKVFSKNWSVEKDICSTGQAIDARAEAATPKADEVRCLVVGLLICTSDGRPCFDYTKNQANKARPVEARGMKSCVELPSGSKIWRVVVPILSNTRTGIKLYTLGVKNDGCTVFMPLTCKQDYVFFYSEFRGEEKAVKARKRGWIERIWEEVSKIKTADDTGNPSEPPNDSGLDFQRDIDPTASLPSILPTGLEQGHVELSDEQTSERNTLQQSEEAPVAFKLAHHLPATNAVWSFLDVIDAVESDGSQLSDDRSINSKCSHRSDSVHNPYSSEARFFDDTSCFIKKDEHSFGDNDNAYATVLTELLSQWPDLSSSLSIEILRYLRHGLQQNSTMITSSMVPAFFSHGAKLMHNFRDEIIKTSGNDRDDLLRDLVATLVDDIQSR